MAASELCDFFWTKFCDWYIESAKIGMKENSEGTASTLVYVLTQLLKLLHPFIPFVTEEIYLNLPNHEETIMLSAFPEYDETMNFEVEHNNFEQLKDIIRSIRNARAELNVADNVKTGLFVKAIENAKFIEDNLKVLEKLSNSKNATIISDETEAGTNNTILLNNLVKVFIPNSDMVNIEKEMERLNKELTLAKSELKRAEGKLANDGFVSKAPQKLIDEEKAKIEKYSQLIEKLTKSISDLQK